MASFDVVNKVDQQVVDNVINVVKKELVNRYDFRDSKTEIEFDKKANQLKITTENEMRVKAIEDILIARSVKQNLDPKCFDFSKEHYASGPNMKKEIKIKNGLDKEEAKKVVKLIKDGNSKVQAAIMDDLVRVTGKKIDDLQEVIALLRRANLDFPVQFINMKS